MTTHGAEPRIELIAPSHQFPMEPSNLVLRDLDHDGDYDLVQLPFYNATNGFDPHAYWIENLGKRRFAPLRLCHVAPAGSDEWLERTAFADVSGDAAAEIFVSRRRETPEESHEPLALTPVLSGSPPTTGRVLAPASPWPWTALDLDGDGPAELIRFSATEEGTVSLHVFDRQGDGSFAEVAAQAIDSPLGISPLSEIEALDLDQDGDLDLSLQDGGAKQILERIGLRAFASATLVPSERVGDRWIDIDGDARPDLLMSDGDWLRNLGGLAFAGRPELAAWQQILPASWYTVSARPGEMALFHAVLATPDNAFVFATYQVDSAVPVSEQVLQVTVADGYPWFFRFEDLDGDGHRDLLFRSQKNNGSTVLDVLWGSSKPFKSPARIFAAPPRFQPFFTGDFDEDGRPDLILGPDGSGMVSLRRSRGPQDLGESEMLPALKVPRHSIEIVQTGDADGDGHLDLIFRCIPETMKDYEAVLAVARGRGNGKFSRPVLPAVQPSGAAVGGEWVDWDLDGDPDLVGFGYLQQNTRGKFRSAPSHLIDLCNAPDFLGNPVTIGFTRTGDLDGDGAPDIVSAVFGDAVSGPNGLFGLVFPDRAGIGFNDGRGGIETTVEIPAAMAGTDFLGNPTVPGVLVLADFDIDGDLDICMREIAGNDLLGNPLMASRWLENPGNGSRDPASWVSAPIAEEDFPIEPPADFDGDGAADPILGGNGQPLLLVYRPK